MPFYIRSNNSLINIFFFTTFFTFTNYYIFKYWENSYCITHAITIFTISFLFLILFSLNKYVIKIFLSLFSFGAVILIYGKYNFNISPNINAVGLLLQTDIQEISELIEANAIFAILLYVILQTIIYKANFKISLRYAISSFLILIIITLLYVLYLVKNKENFVFGNKVKELQWVSTQIPFNFIFDTFIEIVHKLKSHHNKDLSKLYNFNLIHNMNNFTLILVIGESARFDHFGINGYNKDTTPNLNKIKNLITLNNYYALETVTRLAVPYIFKRSQNKKFIDENESSFIPIFKSLGFKTYYLTMQCDNKDSIFKIVSEFDYFLLSNKFSKSFDNELIQNIENITNKNENKLIVLHTMGSHYKYCNRYPSSFQDNNLSCYDNSIKYTDYFLWNLYSLVKDKKAIIFYTSDHGESLEKDKFHSHGHPIELAYKEAPEQIHIPGIWIFTEPLLSSSIFEQRYKQIQSKSNNNMDQSMVFYSLLGCSGISSSIILPDKNMCFNKDTIV